MHPIILLWAASVSAGLVVWLVTRREARRPAFGAMWRASVAAGLPAGLMIAYGVAEVMGTVSQVEIHRRWYVSVIVLAAWAGVVLGPLAFFESMRLASPLRTAASLNVSRIFLASAWCLASYTTVMDFLNG